ncbi:MAG: phenylalanine--tRNA ligase subunit beta [Clostridia bacterium]|nr:phenylalanine--tRNA ligase subunit beta [Clostridia bacterium]
MKLSLNWIKDYVSLPSDMDLKQLAFDLTMSTVEVEGAEELGKRFDGIVVGEIKEVLPHPNADKLRVCKVDTGDEDLHDIVCGGSNLEVGMKVVVACPGAFVRWHGEGEPVEIKNAKLRGVASYGMICASVEVGLDALFPAAEEHEIMDLTSFDVKAGTPLAKALDLDDIILEIDNKSMTNRPDLWGHYGIAREIAALYDLPLKSFAPFVPDSVEVLELDIQDTVRCPRYIGVKMEGLSVKASPFEMQSRIWRVGMRPINALVDITNYVMLATGQPTHAFDADHIHGHITVRRAGEGEELLLLNGKSLTLTSDDLAIADSQGVVALAGVMGGAKDSILPTTEKVILEVANFESTGVRRTALRYDNRTESSSRYEKAIDPERCDQALSLSMQYFKALYPEMKVVAMADHYPTKLVQKQIDVSLNWLERRLGKRISEEDLEKKLGALGYTLAFDGDNMHITVPTWRSTGDVSIKADIMEEVARMYGYENFEATPIVTSFEGAINQLDVDLVRKIKEYLAIRCGMQEVFTYPWMSDEFVSAILGDTTGVLKLSTPPSPTESYIRSSLLPNLCKAVVKNERYFSDFAIFEEAQIFRDENYTSKYDEREKLPTQERHLAGAFAGESGQMKSLFLRAKGVLANMSRLTHMEGFTFTHDKKPGWADDTVWLNVCLGGEVIGDLALLSKKASMACGIKNLSVILFELNLDALRPFRSRTNEFSHLPEFPVNLYDVSLLFDVDVKWDVICATALRKKKPDSFLRDVTFVEEYKGKQVPEGKKSVTLRLHIGSSEKTLTSGEIEKCAEGVIKDLARELGGEVRQ